MSTQGDPLPAPPPYSEQPPPYTASPPSSQGDYPPSYAAPPPPPPKTQPCPPYGATSHHPVTVVRAQPVVRQVVVDQMPPHYIGLIVLVMVFGCWIFGFIALKFSMRVGLAWAAGDREGARRYSAKARAWSLAGIIFGVVISVVIVVVSVAVSAAVFS